MAADDQKQEAIAIPRRLFTPTQRRMLLVLVDGGTHSIDEFKGCLWDDMNENPLPNIRSHLSKLRPLVEKLGVRLVTSWEKGKPKYTLMRPLEPGEIRV